MERRSRLSHRKKLDLQADVSHFSPVDVLDTFDAGDDVQRRFRYQHAYGAILLIAALRGKEPYSAIRCEHHEDLLGELADGTLDGYQIKTNDRGEKWNLLDEALRDSIKRFVKLHQKYADHFRSFFFISNVGYEQSTSPKKLGRSPKKFLIAIKQATTPSDLASPFSETFESLRAHCDCEPHHLLATLKKMDCRTGPGLESYEAEITLNHLSKLSEAQHLSASALKELLNTLISQIFRASSLSIDDPDSHLHGVTEEDSRNPALKAKCITVESLHSIICDHQARFLKSAQTIRLDKDLKFILESYLGKCFREDKLVRLDQAGDNDSERTTLLHQVFVDLELHPWDNQPPFPHDIQRALEVFLKKEQKQSQVQTNLSSDQKVRVSAMNCFLKGPFLRIIIIGGPGQGKSTLGQYLAQVHRAALLKYEKELYRIEPGSRIPTNRFQPETVRVPFRIVLKYFAQWLVDRRKFDSSTRDDSLEAYIAEQIGKSAARQGKVTTEHVHHILEAYPALVIFDGLDEVTEPDLSHYMISQIVDFLERAERVSANLQVVATSRPTSYKDQFRDSYFWHLELQPMSPEKVREYAESWANIKEPVEEERRRINNTLEKCFKEGHTSSLLTTPLQVTIILLIIKGGGHPPSQREGLFQRYWNIILQREEAKLTNIIETDGKELFKLHAYLGYRLHHMSASGKVPSRVSEKTLEKMVYEFLREKDNFSSVEAITKKVKQMVHEARTRLVLLVEPVPGFFGFELQSFREFFASAYLYDTAKDTKQCFDRLRAIARSAYWRNIALFFAGRVKEGEAANILVEVCLPIDDDPPDKYLHRGAWLALDIAVDDAFRMSPNLQHQTLKMALTALDTGMTLQMQTRFGAAMGRLPLEENAPLLNMLLKHNLEMLPPSCLPPLLNRLSLLKATKQNIQPTLERMIASKKGESIRAALRYGFQYEVDPDWQASQLKMHWHTWIRSDAIEFYRRWLENPEYLQKVLSALALTADQASDLMDYFLVVLDLPLNIEEGKEQSIVLENANTFSEQIILLIQNLKLVGRLRLRYSNRLKEIFYNDISLKINIIGEKPIYKHQAAVRDVVKQLDLFDMLLKRKDLLPQLRCCLWIFFLYTHKLSEITLVAFLDECDAWRRKPSIWEFMKNWLRYSRPLLSLMLDYMHENDLKGMEQLRPHLTGVKEAIFAQKFKSALLKGLSRLSYEDQFAVTMTQYFNEDQFPELSAMARQLGTDNSRLVSIYTDFSTVIAGKLTSDILRRMFTNLEKKQTLVHSELFWPAAHIPWILDSETANQGANLLHAFMEKLPHQPDLLTDILQLFVKLLSYYSPSQLPTSSLYSILANAVTSKILYPWMIDPSRSNISAEYLAMLGRFTQDEEKAIQQGAITFCTFWVQRQLAGPDPAFMPKLQAMCIDWQLCLSLIKATDVDTRKKGIVLLTASKFPIDDAKFCSELYIAITQAQEEEETRAWSIFLSNILRVRADMSEAEKNAWKNFFENILAQPQLYTASILSAVMESYTVLIGEAGPEIKNETELGLPPLIS